MTFLFYFFLGHMNHFSYSNALYFYEITSYISFKGLNTYSHHNALSFKKCDIYFMELLCIISLLPLLHSEFVC